MKWMPRVRQITSGLTVALLFQFGVGRSLLACPSHGAAGEHGGSPSPMAVSDSREEHTGMPCDEMTMNPRDHSRAPGGGEENSFPSGGNGDCGQMMSCVSLIAELSALRAVDDVVNAQCVAAVTLYAPRADSAGPDHPPPRA
jgi:hypothetical protein